MDILIVLLSIAISGIGIFSLFELLSYGLEKETFLLKRCRKCKTLKFRWEVSLVEEGYYLKYNVCKKCTTKEKILKEEQKRKKTEYYQEDDLIDNVLYSNSTSRRFLRALERD